MRSVRCDVCGTKALMAASQCPKCGHGFEVRDGFGELLPLAHCPTCDSFYPLHRGECRWCGTKPERAPVAPRVWKGVGIAAFVGLAWGAWLVHDDEPATTPAPRLLVVDTTPPAPPPVDSIELAYRILTQPDSADTASAAPPTSVEAAAGATVGDTVTQLASTGVVEVDTAAVAVLPAQPRAAQAPTAEPPSPQPSTAQPESVTADGPVLPDSAKRTPTAPVSVAAESDAPEPVRPPSPARLSRSATAARSPKTAAPRASASRTAPPKSRLAKSPLAKSPPAKSSAAKSPAKTTLAKSLASRAASRPTAPAKVTPRPRRSGGWVNTVARRWVVVRADPSHTSRIVAAVGPDTRVQLGEVRGGWRRIRAKGLGGWVEHRAFFAQMASPQKAGRLAVR